MNINTGINGITNNVIVIDIFVVRLNSSPIALKNKVKNMNNNVAHI